MLPRSPYPNPAVADRRIVTPYSSYAIEGLDEARLKNTTAICNTSASHTFGNVLGLVEQYLVDRFPPDTFRTIAASTTIAQRQVRHLPSQLVKKDLPAMVLVPRIVFGQGEDRFLGNTLMNSRVTDTVSFWGQGSLMELAQDPRRRLYVHGHYQRLVMYIDVVMTFDTFSEQTNWMMYLWNMFNIGHNTMVTAPLELYIPNEFCALISNLIHIPIHGEGGSVYDFLTYMNSAWGYPITYKMKGGSNTDEFFLYHVEDIDTVVQEPQSGQGVKDNQIRRGFDISFTVRCDFNSIGYFMLSAPAIEKQIIVPSHEDQVVIPMLTDTINLDDFQLPVGWKILSWPIFKLDHGSNSIDIDPILNESLRTVIDHHLRIGIPMEKFIQIQFRENGKILTNEAFYIDWGARRLYIANPNYRRTYRLIVSCSIAYINNLVKELYQLE